MRVERPIGTLLLLWPTLWALWLAGHGQPDRTLTFIFILGVFLMRSAGCVVNDIADYRFDAQVARTRDRPLARNALSLREALTLLVFLLLLAGALLLFLNFLTQVLALLALLLAVTYPFAKRFHYLPQVHLGAAFAMAIPMAFAAQQDTVPLSAWGLYGLTLLWAVIYDTFYAITDKEDDVKIGVKSSALLFGDFTNTITLFLQCLMIIGLIGLGFVHALNWPYYLGVGGAALCFVHQQQLIATGIPQNGFRAFLNNNWVGGLIFAGLLMSYLPLRS